MVDPKDDDDPDGDENVSHENNMQVAAQGLEDDDEEVEAAYANNEYVEPEDPHPDELEGDGCVHSTCVENIMAEFNLSTVRTATDDLKVGEIFDSLKQKLIVIHNVPDIYRTRQDLLNPLLDVHDIKEMRRQDHHIHSLPPRL